MGGNMLNSLYVGNFRALEDFEVKNLGRVNLIVGKNNSGKSTVLEALRIFSGNANRALLEAIAVEHDEKSRLDGSEVIGADADLPFSAFFTGRCYPEDDETMIVIGEAKDDPDALRISHGFLREVEETVEVEGEAITRTIRRPIHRKDALSLSEEAISRALFVRKSGKSFRIRFDFSGYRMRNSFSEIPIALPCGLVPTRFVTIDELSVEWDKVVLTEYESIVKEALTIISPDFVDLAFVDDNDSSPRRASKRYAKVRLSSSPMPVPLNSMGDGVVRVLQLILKAISAKGGILLIDEFENGLHFSVQEKVWGLLFRLASKLNIQIFATTHSWDCIESFANVAIEMKEEEGVLFRVGRSVRSGDQGRIIATAFDEAQLKNITQAAVEVR
ncbi:AAA family ATPase [Burkholderia gladioli]|uniref:AAA family ATPase n=1 Tax=Burkholderia gladioli TaxID=28095 RepID=UPI001641FB56|nr:ATP-binding protein [Burkholderia gladioli]